MPDLDDKLKEIQSEIGCCYYHMEGQEFRDRLKLVFEEAGYLQHDEFGVVKTYTHKATNVMTGQEWLTRFNDELKHLISRGDGETWMGWGCNEVIQAARRAAGLTEK